MNLEEALEKKKAKHFWCSFPDHISGYGWVFGDLPPFPFDAGTLLERESLLGGGWVTSFVSMIKDFAFVDSASGIHFALRPSFLGVH